MCSYIQHLYPWSGNIIGLSRRSYSATVIEESKSFAHIIGNENDCN